MTVSFKKLVLTLVILFALVPRARADDLLGKTLFIDVTVPICAYSEGTQECVWEHEGWFYLAAIYIAQNGDLFYSFSFHSNVETEGVRIPKGSTSGERVSKDKEGRTDIDTVEVERISENLITATHIDEWVEDKIIKRNTFTIEADAEKCEITKFRQETFTGKKVKYAYAQPTSLICKVHDGPQTTAHGD